MPIAHRVFGLETEYPFAFEPEDPAAPQPNRREIYRAFRACLKKEVSLLPAGYKKEADFLENGSLVHHEIQIRHFDQGLLEWATPECLTPADAVAFSHSQDELLTRLRPAIEKALKASGYAGRLRFLKNNVDRLGNSYGCHENYECLDARPRWRRALRDAGFAVFWAVFLPVYLLPRAVFVLALLLFLVLILGYFVLHLLEKLPLAGGVFRRSTEAIDRFMADRGARLDEDFVRVLAYFIEWLYHPFVRIYSAFCNRFLFERYVAGLTAHLASRFVFCGTGRVDLAGSPSGFRLSQRSVVIDSVQRIFWNERTKPIFDIKNVLIEPFSLLARVQRLHLIAGDSNLSEPAEFLKVGTTALVVGRIEDEGPAGLPVLADPLGAIDAIACDPDLAARVELADGRRLTAIELQREYLEDVRRWLAKVGVIPIWAPEVLRAWADVLDRLEARSGEATGSVEWLMKKRLLDAALWGQSTWADMVAWAPILEEVLAAVEDDPAAWTSGVRIVASVPPALDRSLGERGIDPDELARRLDLYLVLRRIDFQFHELDPEDGYWRRLEAEGLADRLLDRERVERACREPPADTRACTRGSFVRLANARRLVATASWDRIRLQHPRVQIRLADPRANPTEPLEDLLGLRARDG